ncbi:MAG: bifunctional diaminohydroxyphosphoribosylaminopyrimidine deaminase/5-amino-6-(5-phosphoribosylamino)uracil reductase RibD [Candidatus Gastranaerophilales bacterium]|nr:bifunctional diaminohydroxyphosphoribosylaminopyrimidine deaminase/5-amino-6-(5-phosphoribosylamino)uracil reductase RibD [Candidatus Gastranaerophilales bacterium]
MYKELMRKCIELAKKSEGHTSPNPLVGAIIFDDDFNIISQGRHEKYGENHAERNAILSYNGDLKGKNIIVNLEPCSHYGKTPPCADLIIEKGIKRVVLGNVDPNPKVAGGGIKKLKDAGIEVITGVLKDECYELNEVFMINQIHKRSFVAIKTATTLDGKIATKTGSSKWITDEVSRLEVQKLRNKYDAILTSSETVIKDNPSMTCRMDNGRNPIRIVLDTNLKTYNDSKIYDDDGTRVIVIVSEYIEECKLKEYKQNIEFIKCPLKNGHIDIKKALEKLYENGIMSVLIEAGGTLNNAFIQENLVDKLYQFVAPKILADNTGINFVQGCDRSDINDCNNLTITSTKLLKNDIMIVGKFQRG